MKISNYIQYMITLKQKDVLKIWISLTHLFQLSITPGRSLKQDSMPTQCGHVQIFAYQPTLAHPSIRIQRRTVLMSSSFLFQQYPVCLVLFGWFVRWEVNGHTATVFAEEAVFHDVAFWCSSHPAFLSCFIAIQVVHLCSSINTGHKKFVLFSLELIFMSL